MTTGIQWTDATWNPVRGCSRVSPGCSNCYAMNMAHRFSGPGKPYDGLTTIRKGKVDWAGHARFVPSMLDTPLKWKKPRRIFVNSMSDLFHHSVTNEQIASVFGVMAACPQHTFQILTKRPERMLEWFDWVSNVRDENPCFREQDAGTAPFANRLDARSLARSGEWPLRSVWLGVSAEDQERADERIPLLLQCPAAVRFVSCEPLLGPISLESFMWPTHWHWPSQYPTPEAALAAGAYAGKKRQRLVSAHAAFIDWVIVGGESGPGARPMQIEWAESLRDQCAVAGVAFFTKQIANPNDRKGGDPRFWPAGPWPRGFPR